MVVRLHRIDTFRTKCLYVQDMVFSIVTQGLGPILMLGRFFFVTGDDDLFPASKCLKPRRYQAMNKDLEVLKLRKRKMFFAYMASEILYRIYIWALTLATIALLIALAITTKYSLATKPSVSYILNNQTLYLNTTFASDRYIFNECSDLQIDISVDLQVSDNNIEWSNDYFFINATINVNTSTVVSDVYFKNCYDYDLTSHLISDDTRLYWLARLLGCIMLGIYLIYLISVVIFFIVRGTCSIKWYPVDDLLSDELKRQYLFRTYLLDNTDLPEKIIDNIISYTDNTLFIKRNVNKEIEVRDQTYIPISD